MQTFECSSYDSRATMRPPPRRLMGRRSGGRSKLCFEGRSNYEERSFTTRQCQTSAASSTAAAAHSRGRPEHRRNEEINYKFAKEKVASTASSSAAGITAPSAVDGAVTAAADAETHSKNTFRSATGANDAFDGRDFPSGAEGDDRTSEKVLDNLIDDDLGITAYATAPAQTFAPASDVAVATRLAALGNGAAPGVPGEGQELSVLPAGAVFCLALGTWGDVFPLFCASVRTLEIVALRTPVPGATIPLRLAKQGDVATPYHLEVFFATHACWAHVLLRSVRGSSALAAARGGLPAADGEQTRAPEDADVDAAKSVTCTVSGGGANIGGGDARLAERDKGQSDAEVTEGDEEDGERKGDGDKEAKSKGRPVEPDLNDAKNEKQWVAGGGDGYVKQTRRVTEAYRHMACSTDEHDNNVVSSSFYESRASSQQHAPSSNSHFFRVGVLSAQQAHARVKHLQHSVTDAWRCCPDGTTVHPQVPALSFRHITEAAFAPWEPVSTRAAGVASKRSNHGTSRVSSATRFPADALVASDTHAPCASSATSSPAAVPSAASPLGVSLLPAAESRAATGARVGALGPVGPASSAAPSVCAASASMSANHSHAGARLHTTAFRAPCPLTLAAASTLPAASTPPSAPRSRATSLPSGATSALTASKVASRCCLWFVPLPSSPLLHSAEGRPPQAASSFPCVAEEIEPLMRLLVGTEQQQTRRHPECSKQSPKAAFGQSKGIQEKVTHTVGCAQQQNTNTETFLDVHVDARNSQIGRISSGSNHRCDRETSRCKVHNRTATTSSRKVGENDVLMLRISNARSKNDSSIPLRGSTPVAEKRVLPCSITNASAVRSKVGLICGRSTGVTSSRCNVHDCRTARSAPGRSFNARCALMNCNLCAYRSGCRTSVSSTRSIPNADGNAGSRRRRFNMSKTNEWTWKRRRRTNSMTEKRRKRGHSATSSKENHHLPVENEDNKNGSAEAREEDTETGDAEEDIGPETQLVPHSPLACVCVCNPFSVVWLHAAEAVGMARLLLVPTPALALRDPPRGLVEALLSRYPQLQEQRLSSSEQVQDNRRFSIRGSQNVRVTERQQQQSSQRVVCFGEDQPPPQQEMCESAISAQRYQQGDTLEQEQPHQEQLCCSQKQQQQHREQQQSSYCSLEESQPSSFPIPQRQLQYSNPSQHEQGSVQARRRHILRSLQQQFHLSDQQYKKKRYRIAAEDCSSEFLLSISTCTKSRDNFPADCGESEVSCTSACSSTRQLKKQQRLLVEGGLLRSTDSRPAPTVDAVGERSAAGSTAADISVPRGAALVDESSDHPACTGVHDTEDEIASDVTREAAAVARWAVQTASRLMLLEDLRHWHWRLCLDDHDAFREQVLGIAPVLLDPPGADAPAALSDATAEASDTTAAPTAAASDVVAAAGDGTAAAGTDAAGAATRLEGSVCDIAGKEAAADEETARKTVAASSEESKDVSFMKRTTCILSNAANAFPRTDSRTRCTPNSRSSSKWCIANNSDVSKLCVRNSSSSVCSRRSRRCPIASSRSSSVVSSIRSDRTSSRSWMPGQAGEEGLRRTSGSSDPQSLSAAAFSKDRNTTLPRAIPVVHFIDTDLFPEALARLPASALAARPPHAPWKALETLLKTMAAAAEAQETIPSPLHVSSDERDRGKAEDTQGRKAHESRRLSDYEKHAGPAESTERLQHQQPQRRESDRQEKQQIQKKWHRRRQREQHRYAEGFRPGSASLVYSPMRKRERGQAERRTAGNYCSFTADKIAKRVLRQGDAHRGSLPVTGERQLLYPGVGLLKERQAVSTLRVSFFDDAGRPCFPVFSQHKSRRQATAGGISSNVLWSEIEQCQWWEQEATETSLCYSPAAREAAAQGLQREILMSQEELLTLLREAGAARNTLETADEAAETCAALPAGKVAGGTQSENQEQSAFAGTAAFEKGLAGSYDGVRALAGGRGHQAVASGEDMEPQDGLERSCGSQQQQDSRAAVKKKEEIALSADIFEGYTQENSFEVAGTYDVGTLLRDAEGETLHRTSCEEHRSPGARGRASGVFAEKDFLAALNVQQRTSRPMEGMKIAGAEGWLIYVAFGSMHARELDLLPSVPCLAQALAHVGVSLNKRVLLHVPFSSFDAAPSLNPAAAAPSSSQEGGRRHCRRNLRRCARQEDRGKSSSCSWRVLVLHSVVEIPLLLKNSMVDYDVREYTAEVGDPQCPREVLTMPESVCTSVRAAAANRRAAALNVAAVKAAARVTDTAASDLFYEEPELSHLSSSHPCIPDADALGDVAEAGPQQKEASKDVSEKATEEDWDEDIVERSEEATGEALGKEGNVDASVGDLRDTQKVVRCKEDVYERRVMRRHSGGREKIGNAYEASQASAPPRTGHTKGKAFSSASAAGKITPKPGSLLGNMWKKTSHAATASGHARDRISGRSVGKGALESDSRGVSRDKIVHPGGNDGAASRTKRANDLGGAQRAPGVFYMDQGARTCSAAADTKINFEDDSKVAVVEQGVSKEKGIVNLFQNPRENQRLFCLLTHASAGAAATFIPLVTESIPTRGGCYCFWKQISKRYAKGRFQAPSHTAASFSCTPIPSGWAHGGQVASQQLQEQRLQDTRESVAAGLPCARSANAAAKILTRIGSTTAPSREQLFESSTQCLPSLPPSAQQRMSRETRRLSLSQQTSREELGVPWLVFPFFFDQPLIATRLAAHGLATVASELLLDCLEELAAIEKKLAATQKREQLATQPSVPAVFEQAMVKCGFHTNTPHSRSTVTWSTRYEWPHENASASQLRSEAEQHLRRTFETAGESAGRTRFQPHRQTCQPRTDRETDGHTCEETNSELRTASKLREKFPSQRETTVDGETRTHKRGHVRKAAHGLVSRGVSAKTEGTSPVTSETSECFPSSSAYEKDRCASPRVLGDLSSRKEPASANQRERDDRESSTQSGRLFENELTRLQHKLARLLVNEIRAAVWQRKRARHDAREALTLTAKRKTFNSHPQAAAARENGSRRCIFAISEEESKRQTILSANTQHAEVHGTGISSGGAPEHTSRSSGNSEAEGTAIEGRMASADAHMRILPVGETEVRVVREDGARVAAWAILALLQQQQQQRRQGSLPARQSC